MRESNEMKHWKKTRRRKIMWKWNARKSITRTTRWRWTKCDKGNTFHKFGRSMPAMAGHDGRLERERINYNFDAPYNKWNAELWLKMNAKMYKCDCVSSRTHRLLSIGGLSCEVMRCVPTVRPIFSLAATSGLMVTTLWEVLGTRAFIYETTLLQRDRCK